MYIYIYIYMHACTKKKKIYKKKCNKNVFPQWELGIIFAFYTHIKQFPIEWSAWFHIIFIYMHICVCVCNGVCMCVCIFSSSNKIATGCNSKLERQTAPCSTYKSCHIIEFHTLHCATQQRKQKKKRKNRENVK